MTRSLRLSAVGTVLVAFAVAACGDSGVAPLSIEETAFAPSLGIDLNQMTRLPSGVYVETLQEGEEERLLARTDAAVIRTTGRLVDGQVFQPQSDLTGPVANYVQGFQDGVEGMRLNERRLMIVPWELGFGAGGFGPVPSFAHLVFEVQLLEFLN